MDSSRSTPLARNWSVSANVIPGIALFRMMARSAARLRKRALYLVGMVVIALIMAGVAAVFASRNSTLAVQNAESARSMGSLGLGLTLARSILRAHGGDVEVDWAEAHGTLFRLRIPRGQKNASRRPSRPSRPVEPTPK